MYNKHEIIFVLSDFREKKFKELLLKDGQKC